MSNKINLAEVADRNQQLITLAMFLMSLKYVASAAAEVANENTVYYLGIIEIVFAVLAVCIIVPVIVWKFWNLTKVERKTYFDSDGYFFSIGKKAMSKSWTITFVVLVFFEPVTKNFLAHLPPRFFINAIIAFLLGTFSIIFFMLDRKGDAEEFGDEA